MALNATIFPAFGAESFGPDFSDGPGGPGAGMGAYMDALDTFTNTPSWRDATRRIVVGHSFGGMLALAWLLRHNGTGQPPIHGLVLISTTAGPMYDVAAVRLPPFRLPAKPLMPIWNSGIVSAATKLILGGGRTGTVDFQQYRGRSELAVGIAGWRQTTVRGRRAYRAGMVGYDVRNRLQEVNVPAIVLHGTHDTYFRVREAQALATGLSAELRLLPGARHVPPLSHPQAVRAAVAALS